jgi:23S rRNA (cytidine1920-2'-O)/16S rRNA (cytidine1409-2'-O)-methyltransferase
VRLDRLLVERGLAPSRERAQRLVMAGDVIVDDHVIAKPGTEVDEDAVVRLRAAPSPYASRGGEKLAGALDAFGIDPRGRVVLDVGASTGGFTDVCLRRGARRVFAVDVGYGQLAWALRQDPRVDVLDRTNARRLAPALFDEPADLAVVDVSFISLVLVLPAVVRVLASRADVLALVKPQFEVGKGEVGKGGVVRDDAKRAEAVRRVRDAMEQWELVVRGEAESVLAGPKGNREVFLWGSRGIEPSS